MMWTGRWAEMTYFHPKDTRRR